MPCHVSNRVSLVLRHYVLFLLPLWAIESRTFSANFYRTDIAQHTDIAPNTDIAQNTDIAPNADIAPNTDIHETQT